MSFDGAGGDATGGGDGVPASGAGAGLPLVPASVGPVPATSASGLPPSPPSIFGVPASPGAFRWTTGNASVSVRLPGASAPDVALPPRPPRVPDPDRGNPSVVAALQASRALGAGLDPLESTMS